MVKAVNFHTLSTRMRRVHLSTVVFVLMLLAFIGTSTYFALNLKRDIVPDEGYHIGVSKHFASTWGFPPDVPETYLYGSLQHKPFLYHWINGRLINVLQLIFPDPGEWKILVLLRLTNVLYATLAVIFCYLLAREIIRSRWWQLLPVFLLTNTLMFVFLAGGVNYDNLVNLCSFAGIYYLARLLNGKPLFHNSLGWMIWILFGMAVKITVLPLLAIMGLIWVIHLFRNRKSLKWQPVLDRKTIPLLALFIGLVIVNFAIFGLNLIKFRTLTPPCNMILTEEQCGQSSVYARDKSMQAEQKLTLMDMLNENVPDPYVWFDDYWVGTMIRMSYGIMGFRTYFPSDLMVTIYRLWLIAALLAAVRVWKRPSPAVWGLVATVIFYVLVLLQTNLSSELNTGFKHLGIHGRYLFPIIGPLYILIAYSFSGIRSKMTAGVIALLTLAIFMVGSPLKTLMVAVPVNFPTANLSPEVHTIEIGSGLEVSQDFQSECPGTITEIGILAASEGQDVTYPVRFRLVDVSKNQVIEEQVIDEKVSGQTWLMPGITPMRATKDQPYRILLTAADNSQTGTLQLWSTTTNVYRGGDAVVRGIPTNYDLIFRYTCQMPILTEWLITSEGQ